MAHGFVVVSTAYTIHYTLRRSSGLVLRKNAVGVVAPLLHTVNVCASFLKELERSPVI
jgi:hypothetical protein